MKFTREYITEGDFHAHEVEEIVFSEKSEYQNIEILRTKNYGIGLYIDGRIQHLHYDEYIYSEIMTHPAMYFLGKKNIDALCIGGGPGGVVRELLKYEFVQNVVQIDIDKKIIELSKRYLSHITDKAYDDRRYDLEIADATHYLKNGTKRFDLIVNDLNEPIAEGASIPFFQSETIEYIHRSLKDDGIYVCWAGSASPLSFEMAEKLLKETSANFPFVLPLISFMPAYGTSWLTLICSKSKLEKSTQVEDIDTFLNNNSIKTKYFDGVTFQHMKNLPLDVRKKIGSHGN